MKRIAFFAGFFACSVSFVTACGDDGGSDLGNGGGSSADAGEDGGGASGKGGAANGGSTTGGASGKGGASGAAGTATGGRSNTGGGPTGGGGTDGGSAGAPGGGVGGASGGEGGTSVVGSPPVATINHPGNGEMRDVGDPIPFVGVGSDAEDGMLTGARLVWSSDREGMIGTGQMFDAALTETGAHVITLTVTDNDGNQDSDEITLNMQ